MIKKCLNCKKETNNPKFCNSSCSAIYNNKLRKIVKYCLTCEKEIPKRNKYCNNICQKNYENEVRVLNLINGKYINKSLRFHTGGWAKKYLLKLFNNKCVLCGVGTIWSSKELILEVDHIDGHAYNNSIDNLRLLCPNCHSQTDTYRAKNVKSDRIDRYK